MRCRRLPAPLAVFPTTEACASECRIVFTAASLHERPLAWVSCNPFYRACAHPHSLPCDTSPRDASPCATSNCSYMPAFAPPFRCSILHAPGEDSYGYEAAAERWRPIHTAESILLSVISMLADPNTESPANIDAAVRAFRSIISPEGGLGHVVRDGMSGTRNGASAVCCSQKQFRDDNPEFVKRVKRCVRKSQDDF